MKLSRLGKRILPAKAIRQIVDIIELLPINSIRAAIREQGLLPTYNQLCVFVSDITHQYSTFDLDTEYLKTKLRTMHSFQISLVNEAKRLLNLIKSSELQKILKKGLNLYL